MINFIFFDLKSNNKNNKINANINNIFITINKTIKYNFENIKIFCKVYIKSKHIKIIKLKKMIPIIKKVIKNIY